MEILNQLSSQKGDKKPDIISAILPTFQSLIEKDESTTVRDYAADTIANIKNNQEKY